MEQTIYEKYGFEIISEVVRDFYGRVLKSPIAAPYFVGIDMPRLIHHQTQFLSQLLGGPVHYEGRDLERVHRSLNITDEAFVEIAELLDETLEDHDFTDEECEIVGEAIESHRSQIVSGAA